MAHILAKIGWPVAQLDGGYKSFRQHVIHTLPTLAAGQNWQVVCGTTGSGKSRLLQTMAAQGAQVLDLEQLALHRGSVLGHIPSQPQPSQKYFESAIWQVLRQCDPAQPVWVEAESKKVGNLRVPDCIMEAMRAATCVNLTLALPMRVQLLLQDYTHFTLQPAQLTRQLQFLSPLHGNEKIRLWAQLAETGHLPELVQQLLQQHYDPAYLRSIERNFSQYGQAPQVQLDGIEVDDFAKVAQQLRQL
jgi:tRNA 2-selenouridine synthase